MSVTTTKVSRTSALSARRRWYGLVVLSVAQFMVILDTTVVNLALSTIERKLDFSPASLAWVVNGYLISFAGLLAFAGRLGDLLGRKRVFLAGLGAFVATSAACGLSWDSSALVVARFLQGASAATMSSMVLGMLLPMFPEPSARTRALSVFGTVTQLGAVLGLPLGGVVIESLGWHWIFLANVPIGLACMGAGYRLLDDHVGLGIRAGADLVGTVILVGAPMLLVYGLVRKSMTSWASAQTAVPFVVALAAIPVFIMVEARARTPIIPLLIFRNRTFVTANVVRFLFAGGLMCMTFLASQFLQEILKYGPARAGVAFLPNSFLIALVSLVVVPRLLARVGVLNSIVAGLGAISAGLLLLSLMPVHAKYVQNLLPGIVLIGIGTGLAFTPSVMLALSHVTDKGSGLASGLTNVAAQMGGSIGVALVAAISAARTADLMSHHVGSTVALAQGFQRGLLVAAMFPLLALVVAVAFSRSRQPVVAYQQDHERQPLYQSESPS